MHLIDNVDGKIVSDLIWCVNRQGVMLITNFVIVDGDQAKSSFSLQVVGKICKNFLLHFSFSFVVHVQVFMHGSSTSIDYLDEESLLVVVVL